MAGEVRIRHRTRNDGSAKGADFDHPLPVYGYELPNGAVPFFFQDTGAAASIVLTVPVAVGDRAYVLNWGVDGKGATASAEINVTITNILGGTLTIPYRVVAGATLAAVRMDVSPPFAWPSALADGADVVMTVPSFGAGNLDAMAWILGYTIAD